MLNTTWHVESEGIPCIVAVANYFIEHGHSARSACLQGICGMVQMTNRYRSYGRSTPRGFGNRNGSVAWNNLHKDPSGAISHFSVRPLWVSGTGPTLKSRVTWSRRNPDNRSAPTTGPSGPHTTAHTPSNARDNPTHQKPHDVWPPCRVKFPTTPNIPGSTEPAPHN